jgi:transmembrane sensor
MDESFINDCLGKDVEARAYWEAFERTHPEYQDVLEEARRCASAMYAWGQSTEVEEQWDKLQEMIGGKEGLQAEEVTVGRAAIGSKDIRPASRSRRPVWVIGVAAAAAGILVGAGLLVNEGKGKHPQPIPYTSFSAPAGTVRKCDLPDGSTVWLDAGSAIRYKEDQQGGRGIELMEGQIFCKVKHDATRPFAIQTPAGLNIKDIGTAFSVQSYKGLDREVIRVLEGEVAVQKGDGALQLLEAHQGIGLTIADGKWTRMDNPSGEDTSWVSGRIELNDVTFGELAIVLEKTYDLHIAFEHPGLMKCRASTSFNRTDPVRDVLDALRLIYGITYTMEGRSLVLRGGSGPL